MNEATYQAHYAKAMQRTSKRLDSEKSRKVHKAICAAIGAKGMPSLAGQSGKYDQQVYDAAKNRLKQQYGSLVGFLLWPLIWAVLRPILELMLPIIIEWLVDQAMSKRMGNGEIVGGLKEWGNS